MHVSASPHHKPGFVFFRKVVLSPSLIKHSLSHDMRGREARSEQAGLFSSPSQDLLCWGAVFELHRSFSSIYLQREKKKKSCIVFLHICIDHSTVSSRLMLIKMDDAGFPAAQRCTRTNGCA